ncbi:hypothetical protein [Methanotorris formicicus]|uniref:Uncharacterized protein n=1 Tax=Methanotorris formicicus Mc-S-70 TaxID=647171 RepID=H1KZF1_9EURY|nr:hypothetical protein [Methanotorris formicicus]EHP86071.1 hypothetical protein MetfoDRAFT_1174 [Methanotorris formicicus Mc-S-70]
MKRVPQTMDLEEFITIVEDFLKKEGFSIYPTSDILESFPNIRWEGGDWKNFIMVAKHEGIKTMFIKKDLFTKEHIESNLYSKKQEDKRVIEYNNKIKSFKKYINKVAVFTMFWIKDDIVYSFTKYAPWAEEFLTTTLDLEDIEEEEEISWM